MRGFVLAGSLFITAAGCASAQPEPAPPPALETEEHKTLYALGFAMAGTLGGATFDDAELELIQRGLADGVRGAKAQVGMEEYGPKLNAMMVARMQLAATKEQQAGQAYCDSMAQKEGAQRTPAGAIYIETRAGSGATPGPTATVKLHYHGTLRDGTVFDSSVNKGQPATFRLDGVVPCFSEGVGKMKVGGKATLVCPSDTAYGERGRPPTIPGGAALTFDVELFEILGGQ